VPASNSTIRRTCPVDTPSARSSPSSRRRCTTPIVRRFTSPTAAITADTATRPIMIPANVSSSVVISCGASPPAEVVSTTFTVSSATANIVTSVTPITTPMAMRLERSG
jgi:hypothetical protein